MVLALILLAWHAYQGSRSAARPTLLQRSNPSPEPSPTEEDKPLSATYQGPSDGPSAAPKKLLGSKVPGSGKISSSGEKVDLNRASQADLQRLPGIGPALAQRILDRRDQLGNFQDVDQLRLVSGIGQKTLEKLRPYVTAGEASRSPLGGE
jgi:competence protein ComEA